MDRPALPPPGVGSALVVLHPPEVRQHAGIVPAGSTEFGPVVVVPLVAADEHQPVDRAAPAQPLAGGPNVRTPADRRIGLGAVAPVEVRLLDDPAHQRRHRNAQVLVALARLDQQHTQSRLCKPRGTGQPGGAASDDDQIWLCHDTPLPAALPRPTAPSPMTRQLGKAWLHEPGTRTAPTR